MRHLQAQCISRETFAPYGWLIDASRSDGHLINGGTSQRSDGQSELELTAGNGKPCLAVFKASARSPSGPWQELERHCLGTQTFIPMEGARYLVMVALGGDAPDPATLAVFAVAGHQGITLRAGIWHHSLMALQACSFVVIERSAAQIDCDIASLSEPVSIRLPPGWATSQAMARAPQSAGPT